ADDFGLRLSRQAPRRHRPQAHRGLVSFFPLPPREGERSGPPSRRPFAYFFSSAVHLLFLAVKLPVFRQVFFSLAQWFLHTTSQRLPSCTFCHAAKSSVHAVCAAAGWARTKTSKADAIKLIFMPPSR